MRDQQLDRRRAWQTGPLNPLPDTTRPGAAQPLTRIGRFVGVADPVAAAEGPVVRRWLSCASTTYGWRGDQPVTGCEYVEKVDGLQPEFKLARVQRPRRPRSCRGACPVHLLTSHDPASP